MDDITITISSGKSIIKKCFIYHSLTDYNTPITYQLAIAKSTSIVVKNPLYCSLHLHNSTLSFLHKAVFINLFSVHFQTKDSDAHAYAYSWLPNNGDRN